MNRRAFLTGLLASSALAPVVVPAPRWALATSLVPETVTYTTRVPWNVARYSWEELWAALAHDMQTGVPPYFEELVDNAFA